MSNKRKGENRMKFKGNPEETKALMNVHEGHRGRLRERLLKTDFVGADEYQVLEYILTMAIKRRDTNELAHTLINTFGSLSGVMDAEVDDLKTVKGVSETVATFLHSVPYIFRNYKLSKIKPAEVITSARDVFNYLGESVCHLPKEEFYIICLDNAHRVISHKNVATGGNSQVAIDLQAMLQYAIKMKARMVVVLHNHPTANCMASPEDIETTKRLYINFKISGIDLYDHIIVDRSGDYYSFANDGRLGKFELELKKIYETV